MMVMVVVIATDVSFLVADLLLHANYNIYWQGGGWWVKARLAIHADKRILPRHAFN